MAETHIEWADRVLNPTSGCDRVSPGCDNCYALGMAKRLKAMGQPGYQNDGDPSTSGPGFALTLHPEKLDQVLRWRKPAKIFLNSMSDIFHKDVPDEYLARVWATMAATPQHTYQVLTKRHGRMKSLLNDQFFRAAVRAKMPPETRPAAGALEWPLRNVWLGVSVEDQQWADTRIPALLATPAAIRWVSAEPLLGPVDLSRYLGMTALGFLNFLGHPVQPEPRLDWVVVGGESGPGARPMHPNWARSLRDQCAAGGVPFLFKQWGAWTDTEHGWDAVGEDAPVFRRCVGNNRVNGNRMQLLNNTMMVRLGKHQAGRVLDGVTHDGYPVVAGA